MLAGKATACHDIVVERHKGDVAEHLAHAYACSSYHRSALHQIVWVGGWDVVHEHYRYSARRPHRRCDYKHCAKEYQHRIVDAFHYLPALAAQRVQRSCSKHCHRAQAEIGDIEEMEYFRDDK